MLIINADDFGREGNVNRSILRCFNERICTSATIMPNMPGFEEACSMAIQHGFQGNVGMHLVLDEGIPLTEAIREQKIFCNKDGELCLSRESPVFWLGSQEKSALSTEILAQIKKCRDHGISIIHVDSHHHVHTEWGIASVLIPILREEKIPFIRIARNLVNSKDMTKRIYKYLYNLKLRREKLSATDYFGSVDEYLRFKDRHIGEEWIIEVMIHPRFKGNELYITESMDISHYVRRMGPYLEKERRISFRDLTP